MSWNEQKIQMLRDMWGHGFSASEIAKKLGGLTRNAVIGKAHRLKLSGRPSPIRREDGEAVAKVSPVRVKPVGKKVMLRPAPSMPLPNLTQRSAVPVVKRATESSKSAVAPLKTTEHQCRWPMGDPRNADFKFCGCNAVEGLPYCLDHAKVAYQNFGRGSGRRRDEDQTNYLTQQVSAGHI